ncbi:hypothetical protein C2845_PM09G20630 [Panicum miliaceum]|uniref:Uncharacterized protein n=1 Tax=Panicum miliaceum TaxID=4540 RepID=A0A3L6S0J8_PANMI|nr:hypothetical protein C2845_PM09G20630 [Panicum miliaceum]
MAMDGTGLGVFSAFKKPRNRPSIPFAANADGVRAADRRNRELHPTTNRRRTFLAALGGGDLLSAGPRGTNTVERSCGTGKKGRCSPGRSQQRFLLAAAAAGDLAGFRGAGGHTVAGRSRHGDDVGVLKTTDSTTSMPMPMPTPTPKPTCRGSRELTAVGVMQPVSAASRSSLPRRAVAAPPLPAEVWIGRSTANSERSSSTPIE